MNQNIQSSSKNSKFNEQTKNEIKEEMDDETYGTTSNGLIKNNYSQIEYFCNSEQITIKREMINYRFTCNNCSTSFISKSSLKSHSLLKHIIEKPYKCTECHKSFIWQETLSHHEKAYNKKKPYIIEHIKAIAFQYDKSNKSCAQKPNSGEKPFNCDICQKSLSYLTNLNTHKLNHTENKQYKYNICKKLFPVKHMKTHTG
ncbi:Zinc finger C2H2-type,Zinc finger, RING/FYVE/PHD-type [Cinara cedri]|uniref:Zinc finger C2H2-type,Zinc finger, RING/FYVE/PHD-type n=1 Tax=Cinara cedri TaxID=506608 RepID=A0A5E4NMD7_9HEMI|nr:Zinc finger C2H2-type,Zinc finger, RING/FYVE/PHD-type [Cinara cedri]